MFSVIVSEKGGAERREVFDRTEINVGRVQGNDLMLPKGNVSKRHARLLFRDGRFIITDLKSTNGTYVNGRKIAQATIVREGDKIYIGDFILRVEAAAAGGVSMPAPENQAGPLHTHQEPQDSSAAPLLEPPRDLGAGPGFDVPLVPAPPPSSVGRGDRGVAVPPLDLGRTGAQDLGRTGAQDLGRTGAQDLGRTGAQVISHFPLENDPDESADAVVPGPPRIPSPRPVIPALAPPTQPITPPPAAARPSSTTIQAPRTTPVNPAGPLDRLTPREHVPGGSGPPTPSVTGASSSSSSLQAVSPRRSASPSSERGDRLQAFAEAVHAAARLMTLERIVERVGALVDLAPLASGVRPDEALARRVEASIAEAAGAMRAAGEIPPEVDPEAILVDARRELLELGPLDPLLMNDEVAGIQVFRHDHVAVRYGRRVAPAEVAFSSEAAVARVIRRLCVAAGEPLREGEHEVERRLPRGARLFAVLPPAATNGHALAIHKPSRADLSLDDLVRSGTVSRGMAGLLSQCVWARANVLVTGGRGSGSVMLLGALAAVGGPDERLVVLQGEEDLLLQQPHVVSIAPDHGPDGAARAMKAATRLQPDRLVVRGFAGRMVAEVVDAISEGTAGVLAAARTPTLRQALARLAADVVAARPGLPLEAAREQLASAFDLVIEIARLRDGRSRVLRVAELVMEGGHLSARDVFTFSVERTAAGGALEGTFHPSGTVPAIVEDLASRGVTVDTGPLRRTR